MNKPESAQQPCFTPEQTGTLLDKADAHLKRVVEAETEFRTRLDGPLNAYVLTGGGTMIPRVRGILVRAAEKASTKQIFDLLDPDEPDRVLIRKRDASGRSYLDPKDVEARLRQSRELTRGGSNRRMQRLL
jgi:hypothetical protein